MTSDPQPRTATVSPDGERGVLFVPLGGLGEVGMNCFALVEGGAVLVVDCGITFPDDDVGVDVIHPDFGWLVQRKQDICGLFITHGHEDHIGAIPYFLAALGRRIEIFAPAHACALLRPRLAERRLDTACLHEVSVRSSYAVGPFVVEPVAVAHSIVDATALAITTSAGTVLHTGDFDFDAEQPAGYLTDEQRLQEIGDRGLRLLLSDSTNVDRLDRGGSEGDVAQGLARVISEEKGRVVVGMFSSNVHRLASLGEIAQKTGRRICLLGRSLSRQADAARAIGRLHWPSSLVLHLDDARTVAPGELLVLAGGSQAEEASSLRRLSLGTHPKLVLEAGDAVVMSARVIVGNERAVYRMQNDLLRQGIVVRNHKTDPGLHVSGHASRSEQLKMLQLTRPQAFIPVHGTLHHLRAHGQLAEDAGVDDVMVVENGQTVQIPHAGPLARGPQVGSGRTLIAVGGTRLDGATRKRRLDLARRGLLVVSLAIDSTDHVVGEATVMSCGLPGIDGDTKALARLGREACTAAREVGSGDREEAVRRVLRRSVIELSGVRPVVLVGVVSIP